MKTIHKHTIKRTDLDEYGKLQIETYAGASVIHVEAQYAHHHLPTVWFEVDERSGKGTLGLWVVPTGGPRPDRSHIGSAVCSSGAYVWHIYG